MTTGFIGAFETHVTVHCTDDMVSRLDAWAATVGAKVTHIVLARGRQPSQPMLTVTGAGTVEEQHRAADGLVEALDAAGFKPVRVKIEASPWADGVPQDDAQAELLGPEQYFEHHIKLLLPVDSDLDTLADLVVPHQAHLSWNARRIASDGRQERFVTQRCHQTGLVGAGARLEALIAGLRGAGHQLISLEREFVVHDSNTAIDDGWIAKEGAR
ncbi:hypothetical protein [Streptacidiphilus sp. PAMC 29251]